MNRTLEVRLRPSRTLPVAILIAHLAAPGAAVVGLPAAAAAVVAAGLVLSATEHVRRALLRAPLAVAALAFSVDGSVAVAGPDGDWCSASLRRVAVPAAWMAVVAIRDGLGRRRAAVILPDALDPAKRRDLLEMIATQAARLSQITDEILLATQLDRGTITIQAEPVDVGAVVRSTLEAMAPDVPVEVDVSTVIGKASGAADRIQQVLVNLVDNALKYGAPPIRVGVDGDDASVRLTVSDSGPGIPAQLLPRIWDPFFTTKPVGQGTGLGLAVCHSIIERHGGTIRVASQPGAGATFSIELPRGTGAEAAPERKNQTPSSFDPEPA